MEGSFGTQKEHYDLRRVKARTKITEIVYLLRHPHGERGAACGQDRATSEAGSDLKDENMRMQVSFQRGTTPLPTRMDDKSGRNDRNEI